MVFKSDPLEPLSNSFQVVKNVFLPLESCLRKAAKDLDNSWPSLKNGTNNFEPDVINADNSSNKVALSSVKKMNGECLVKDERVNGALVKVPVKTLLGMFSRNCEKNSPNKADLLSKCSRQRDDIKEEETCMNCLQFSVTWSLFLNSFVRALPSPFKTRKKQCQKLCKKGDICLHSCVNQSKLEACHDVNHKEEARNQVGAESREVGLKDKEGNYVPLDCLLGLLFDRLNQNLPKFHMDAKKSKDKNNDSSLCLPSRGEFDQLMSVNSIFGGRKAHVSGFLRTLKFARLGGAPSGIIGEATSVSSESDNDANMISYPEENRGSSQKLVNVQFNIPFSNVERLTSMLFTISLTELTDLIPQLGRPSKGHPDKKKLFSVQDFFSYTESEGRRFFEELDRDGDGHVTLKDLEAAMRKRKLPPKYAREFMHCTRSHLFSKSFGWKQFLLLMKQKEPTILRAYTSLCLSKSGTLQKSEILASLENAGLPASEDNAVTMMRFLNADTEDSISYGHFRNFMLLLPLDQLQEDPWSIWLEAATVVSVAPPL